jgi:hypothetical protein
MHNTAFFNDVVGCSPRRQESPMRRREFIAVLGGAATWPLLPAAQAAVSRIGLLSIGTDPGGVADKSRVGVIPTGYG